MIKATLRYIDLCGDGKLILSFLSYNSINIIKTKTEKCSSKVNITIIVDNREILNKIICHFNTNCVYSVQLIKTKEIRQ